MGKFDFRPTGVMPALVTPFNKDDESINEENLRNLVNHLIEQGVTGFLRFSSFIDSSSLLKGTIESY